MTLAEERLVQVQRRGLAQLLTAADIQLAWRLSGAAGSLAIEEGTIAPDGTVWPHGVVTLRRYDRGSGPPTVLLSIGYTDPGRNQWALIAYKPDESVRASWERDFVLAAWSAVRDQKLVEYDRSVGPVEVLDRWGEDRMGAVPMVVEASVEEADPFA